MKKQCSNSFRRWRERLKRDHFKGKSLREAEASCPDKIDKNQWRWLVYNYWESLKQKKRSESNRVSANKKKIFSACGAKSISRVIYEEEISAAQHGEGTSAEQHGEETSAAEHVPEQPLYIKIWDLTKRHKDGKFDDDGEIMMQEFIKLHEEQIKENGVDELSIEEAFRKVLGHTSGYARGLGSGYRVLGKEGMQSKAEMQCEIQRLTQRETEVQAELEQLRIDAQRREEEARALELKREEEARVLEQKRQEEVRALERRMRAEMDMKIQELLRQLGPNN